MKRVFTIVLSVLLLVGMVSGCGAKGKLQGTWQAEADISQVMQSILNENWPDSLYQVQECKVTLVLTFQKDGSCTFSLQEGSVQSALAALQAAMEQDFVDSLRQRLTEMDKAVTLEDVLKVTGTDLETLRKDFRETFQKAGFDSALGEKMRFDGYFKPDGDKLYIDTTEDIAQDAFAFVYQLADGVLTLPLVVGTAPMDASLPVAICSLQFQKAK